MRILVTGADGFIGHHVVEALLRRGAVVRALVIPSSWAVDRLPWKDSVELRRADLLAPTTLTDLLEGVDTVVHLAALMRGSVEQQMAVTVGGTDNLLRTMAGSKTRRIVHVSSFSVYDWSYPTRNLNENSPVIGEEQEQLCDAYTLGKVRQERLVRGMCEEQGCELALVRPGAVWGQGRACVPNIGPRIGPVLAVIGPTDVMRLTHVTNCADAIAAAAMSDRATGKVFNVVDGHRITKWSYAGHYLKRSGVACIRVPLPYRLGLSVAGCVEIVAKLVSKSLAARLPGLLVPRHFRSRFKPVDCFPNALRNILDWTPPNDLKRCLDLTYGAPQDD